MVEGTGLENRHTGNGIVSSNLTLSARREVRKDVRDALGSPGASSFTRSSRGAKLSTPMRRNTEELGTGGRVV